MSFLLQQLINGLALGAVFALYALGFSMVFANMKVFHVGHAAIFTWGAVFAWQLTENLGWPLFLAMPVVALFAGVLNSLTYYLAIRHLQDRKNGEMFVFVSSLGAGIVLTELAIIFLDHKVVRLPFDLVASHTWSAGPLTISSMQVLMLGTVAVMFVGLRWLIGSTQFGREVTAVAADREAAGVLGANVERVSVSVFFLSGALAGVGASLVAVAFNIVDGNLGHNYLVIAMAILVIGGIGSVSGALAGGLLVGLVSALTTGYISSSYRDVVVFGLMLAFLVLRPDGMFPAAKVANRV
ncbi:branched-chain amino acid ABC transporter permease [Gordonia terrae]